MIFHPNINKLMIGRGLLANLNPTTGGCAITLFSGSQAAAADITANWSTYSTLPIAHFQGVVYGQPLDGILLSVTTFPTPVTALATGTVSWAIIWSSNVNQGTVQGSTLPDPSFIVCPVSLTLDDGVVRLSTLSYTIGDTVTLLDSSITAL